MKITYVLIWSKCFKSCNLTKKYIYYIFCTVINYSTLIIILNEKCLSTLLNPIYYINNNKYNMLFCVGIEFIE